LNKNALITGAYGAIGRAIALGLARQGYSVTLVGRDPDRLEKSRSSIQHLLPDARLSCATVDLSIAGEIRKFSEEWNGPLQILVNNAATSPRARTETPEGIEMQWATNVLGYYWMIRFFAPRMKGVPDARIVNVASYWAGGLDLKDPEFRKRYYDNDSAYRQSKQADRMMTSAFSRLLKNDGITVNACHPGDVNSKLSNDLGFGGSETPDQGAATPVWLAISGEVSGITGAYFENRRKQHCPFMKDEQAVEGLMELCGLYSA